MSRDSYRLHLAQLYSFKLRIGLNWFHEHIRTITDVDREFAILNYAN
jgi:hypothetical protein